MTETVKKVEMENEGSRNENCDSNGNITKIGRKIPSKVKDLNELIQEFRDIFASNEVDIEQVQNLLYSYQSNPKDWKKFAHFDRHKYTRNLVDTGNGKYNLMLLCWSEGQGSCIHDHANSHCFMKVLSGTLTEIRFAWPRSEGQEKEEKKYEEEEGMEVILETDIATNDVTYMSDSLGLHRVENKSHVLPAVSLHLYIPPYDSCRVFDQRTGHAMTSNITFYSKGGKKVATISGTSISQDNSKNGLRSGLYKPQVINYE